VAGFLHYVGVTDRDRRPSERSDFTTVNRETYDRIAGLYAANQREKQPSDGRWFPDLEDAFLEGVPARGLLADLGCGPALDGARFAEAGFRVIGMDLSAGMLAIAARSLGGQIAQADVRAPPIREGRLDGIWCAAALLHVPEEDTAQVLREFRRTLKPSGSLALVTAVGDGARLESVPYAPDEKRWFIYRGADRLRLQMREAGFSAPIDNRITGNREWVTLLASAV
jgi:SAM-dependent methyltransferase